MRRPTSWVLSGWLLSSLIISVPATVIMLVKGAWIAALLAAGYSVVMFFTARWAAPRR